MFGTSAKDYIHTLKFFMWNWVKWKLQSSECYLRDFWRESSSTVFFSPSSPLPQQVRNRLCEWGALSHGISSLLNHLLSNFVLTWNNNYFTKTFSFWVMWEHNLLRCLRNRTIDCDGCVWYWVHKSWATKFFAVAPNTCGFSSCCYFSTWGAC